MPSSRRRFFEQSSFAVAWMAALQAAQAFAQETPQLSFPPVIGETDSVAFWNQFFNPPEPDHGTQRGGDSQTRGQPARPGSQVEYVHLGPNGLRFVQDIKPEELAAVSGDVMLSVSPAQFRFGNSADKNGKSENFLHSAQLRFDIHQSQRFLNVLPFLAWTSLAAIFPDKSGKLPSIQELNFTSSSGESAVDKILLPGGMGTFAVNVSAAKKISTLYTVLQDIAKSARVLTPVLGLPAISLVALQAFTALYAQVEQRTTFLLSSTPTRIAVTQDAWYSSDRPAQAVPFPPGDYLLYPKEHSDLIKPEFDKLTIENGYVVRRDADRTLPITDRAGQAVNGLTYVTMHLSISDVKLAPPQNKEIDKPEGGPETKPLKKKKTQLMRRSYRVAANLNLTKRSQSDRFNQDKSLQFSRSAHLVQSAMLTDLPWHIQMFSWCKSECLGDS